MDIETITPAHASGTPGTGSPEPEVGACCAPVERASCCETEDEHDCCGTAAAGECGCR